MYCFEFCTERTVVFCASLDIWKEKRCFILGDLYICCKCCKTVDLRGKKLFTVCCNSHFGETTYVSSHFVKALPYNLLIHTCCSCIFRWIKLHKMFLYRKAWAHAVLYVQMQRSRNLITEMKRHRLTVLGLFKKWKSIQNGSVVWRIKSTDLDKISRSTIKPEIHLQFWGTLPMCWPLNPVRNLWNEKSCTVI